MFLPDRWPFWLKRRAEIYFFLFRFSPLGAILGFAAQDFLCLILCILFSLYLFHSTGELESFLYYSFSKRIARSLFRDLRLLLVVEECGRQPLVPPNQGED